LGEKESKQILKAHKRIQDGLIDLHETLHATVPLRKQAQRLHVHSVHSMLSGLAVLLKNEGGAYQGRKLRSSASPYQTPLSPALMTIWYGQGPAAPSPVGFERDTR
jgi:hypothetical protein